MPAPPNLPTNHVDGQNELITAGLINDLALAANDVATNGARPKGAAGGSLRGTYPNPSLLDGTFNVMDAQFAGGAIGDGTHDDTAAIQACIDAALNTTNHTGTVIFPAPPRWYKVTATIRCYRSDFAMAHVNLIGMEGGNNGILISWQGPTDVYNGGVAFFILENWNFEVRNLNIQMSGAKGTSIGLCVSNHIAGTGTSAGTFTNVLVAGFAYGIQVGGGPLAAGAASELTFIGCSASACNVGVFVTGQNTLDIYFINLSLGQNTVGMQTNNTGQEFVIGGSASGNGTDFLLSGAGTVAVSFFRSETCSGKFVSASGVFVTLIANDLQDAPASGPSITSTGPLTLIGNMINGYVGGLVGGDANALTMYNNWLAQPPSGPSFPFDTTGLNNAIYDCRNNWNRNSATGLFDDVLGRGDVGSGSAFQGPMLHLARGGGRPLAAQWLAGVQGISGSPLEAKNLRGTAVLSGGVASVVFGQAEIQTMTMVGGPTGGITAVSGYLGSHQTPGVAYNASAATVQGVIEQIPNIGVGNVVCSGGPWPSTPIICTFQGALATGPQYLIAWSTGLTGGVSPHVTVTRTTPGSFAESDSNYTVQLTGNVNETFWVTGKGAGGFTIHSSNAASTASVDWMLVR